MLQYGKLHSNKTSKRDWPPLLQHKQAQSAYCNTVTLAQAVQALLRFRDQLEHSLVLLKMMFELHYCRGHAKTNPKENPVYQLRLLKHRMTLPSQTMQQQ